MDATPTENVSHDEKAVRRAVAKPRTPTETATPSKFDPTDISRLLSHSASAARPPTARAVGRAAPAAGSTTTNSQKMASTRWDELDGVLEDQYKQCWSYLGLESQKYIPQIKVIYSPDGALSAEPVLINPPSDPALRSLADSAMRAVRRCNPLRIPAQFAPYYDQWKGRVLRFDPVDMAG
jgi:colicin import membrane protein